MMLSDQVLVQARIENRERFLKHGVASVTDGPDFARSEFQRLDLFHHHQARWPD